MLSDSPQVFSPARDHSTELRPSLEDALRMKVIDCGFAMPQL
jgi:hypothetical protein